MREDQDSEALFHRSSDRADPRAPAVAIEAQLLSIDVTPRFQIVDGAPEILDKLKGPVPETVRAQFTWGGPAAAFEGSLVYGEHGGPSALDHEVKVVGEVDVLLDVLARTVHARP